MWNLRVDNQKKYLLVIASVLLILGLIYRFLPYFREIVSPGQEIQLKETELVKYRKMVASGISLDETLTALNQSLKDLESGLLTGKTPSLAAAELQGILREVTGKSHAEIRRMKVLKPEEQNQGDYISIPIEFLIHADIRQLKEILYRIAAFPKYLSVRKLRATFYRAKGREFRSFITVAGFMKKRRT